MGDRVPERRDSHASSSHEPSLEPTPTRSVDLGKHSVDTHFLKDRNCEICQRTKITRAPCRKRIGGAVPRAENFGDLITADHKVLSEGCESRTIIDIQSWCRIWPRNGSSRIRANKNFSGNTKELAKVLGADEETKNHLQWQKIHWLWQILWRSFLESLYVDTTQIRNKWDCWKSSAQSKGRHLCCIFSIVSKWKLVGRFYGMLHLSAKHSRSLVWWEDTIWVTFWKTIWRTSYPVWSNGRISPYFCWRLVATASVRQESLTRSTLWLFVTRGENLEGDISVAGHSGIGKRWMHLKSMQKDSMQRKV